MTRWLVYPGPDVPRDIRVALIESLYGTLPIFAGGVLNTIAVAALITMRMPQPMFLWWLAFECVLCVTRLVVLVHGRRAAAAGRATPTDLYLLLGVAWALSVGFGTYISVLSGDWVAATLACLSAAAMVGGICFRNFGAPRLVAVMILASLGPCAVAAALSGQPILLVAAFQIPFYLVSMTIAAYRMNRLFVATMRSERENGRRARQDALTGLLNRAGLMRALEDGMHGIGKGALTLFYLDLDDFKPVNDRYGHVAGDHVLMTVAERLEAVAAERAIVARIGGDEFVVIAGCTGEAAQTMGNALIAAIAGRRYDVGSDTVTIGVSVGLATVESYDGDFDALVGAADKALYDAKGLGGLNCAVAAEHRAGARRQAA